MRGSLLALLLLAGCNTTPTNCLIIFEECHYEEACIKAVANELKCEAEKHWWQFMKDCEE